MPAPIFRLKVRQFDRRCWFELTWGAGQQLEADLVFPEQLPERYETWRRIYHKFYETYTSPDPEPPSAPAQGGLRGRVVQSGNLPPVESDWYGRLVEAETNLLKEFQRWLRQEELYPIRAAISAAARESSSTGVEQHSHQPVQVFLSCSTELARLPWEAWEIGADFAITGSIRIVRTPPNIPKDSSPQQRRGKPRILAILGDDTGLDFAADRQAVKSLERSAEIRFVGWQPGKQAARVREEIVAAIADSEGWDLLFFAGHSNEKANLGGELAIAPGASLSIQDLSEVLQTAQRRGLQFALFNSCSGLNLAESLIALGFSQVAVMREPIHNRVAQEFLVRFLQNLALFRNVQESLVAACQSLRTEKSVACPSAYLVPSLFCHPGADLFRIQPSGWRYRLRLVLPTRWEAVVLAGCLAGGLLAPTQQWLLDQRLGMQSWYRDLTGQLAPIDGPAPIALIHIDQESVNTGNLKQINPIDRQYLARLIDQLIAQGAHLIGIDYFLDRVPPRGESLRQTAEAAAQRNVWILFGSYFNDDGVQVGVHPEIADPAWSLQGYTNSFSGYLMLRYPGEDCQESCPFAYLLALAQMGRSLPDSPTAIPPAGETTPLRSRLLNALQQHQSEREGIRFLTQLYLSPLTVWVTHQLERISTVEIVPQTSITLLYNHWFKPILDYSIPPDRVYERVAAWQLDAATPVQLPHLSQQVAIIAPGLYDEAGLVPGGGDSFLLPPATRYWRDRLGGTTSHANPRISFYPTRGTQRLTGGEQLAYQTYQLLTRRLVIPVPDLLVVLPAAVLGVGVRLGLSFLQRQGQWTRRSRCLWTLSLASATTLYGLGTLQLFISAGILLPWLLPSLAFWSYSFTALRRKV